MNERASVRRIALIGSCQVLGLQAALQSLCPDIEIKAWHITMASEAGAEVAAQLSRFDLVVTQFRGESSSVLSWDRLQSVHGNLLYVPIFVFNGFQPDCIYALIQGKQYIGPLSHLQSGIIAASYALGVPEGRVLGLFNSLTYSSMGYFSAFETARQMAIRSFAVAGFAIDQHIDQWRGDFGGFMHTLNHPRICVLKCLAQMIAVRAQLIDACTPPPEDIADSLSMGIQWPIYPEIAKRLGIAGGHLAFRRAGRSLDLKTAVADFYTSYSAFGPSQVRSALPSRLVEGLESALAI